MDASMAGLIGAAIGAGAGLAGATIQGFFSNWQAKKSRIATLKQKRREELADLFESGVGFLTHIGTVLNVKGTQLKKDLMNEKLLARISLQSPKKVRDKYFECWDLLKTTGDPKLLPEVQEVMRQHLQELDDAILK